MKRHTETTTPTLIVDALRRADDFMTSAQLVQATGHSKNRVNTSLHMLKHYNAVDAMESDGRLWWYLTLEKDTRIKTVEERVPESKPRKPRKVASSGGPGIPPRGGEFGR